MRNNLVFQKNLIYVALALSLASVFFVFNFQTSYSQIPEVSYLDVNDTSSVSKFSVAAWFKTSNDYNSDAYIVNKPGSSNNLNYGLWMTSAEKVRGGFETSGGSPMYATSPQSYSDGKWHYATVTFDGSDIILYVDGVQVATKKTSGSPDRGDEPVRVGADSTALDDYFIGNVDEIRVWSEALTPLQVSDAYHDNADTKYQELYLDFSEPIEMVNATSVALNQTALNQTALNQTALNQTALNQTALNQTALNQTALNQTVTEGVNDTATTTNETSTQTNGTAVNETGTIPEPSTGNDTGTSNETKSNISRIQEIPNVNDTGITNETQDNETGPLITEENNSPEAFDQSVSVDNGGQVDITLRATDEDNDPLKFDLTADPVQGTLDNFNAEKGTATYVPQQGYSGSDQFRFRAIDDKGSESNISQVDITVNEESQSNETQPSDLTEPPRDTTNETSTEQDTGASALEQPNQLPNAEAGNDLNVEINTRVNLDGSKSSDQDGEIVSYKWEQTGGPEISLEQSNEQTASFDVPESAADSTLTFKLTVVDDKDATDTDEVTVEIESVVDNEAQQTETETDTKTDANQQTETETETDTKTDANQQTETETETDTNTNQQTETEQVEQENIAPKADAGGDKNAEVNTEVKLEGGQSSDEDGEIVSYKWEQTDGPKVDLKNSDEQTASFDVPESAADSKLSFKLTVTDDKDASDSDDTTVEVQSVPQETDEESDADGNSNANDNSDANGNSDNKGRSG